MGGVRYRKGVTAGYQHHGGKSTEHTISHRKQWIVAYHLLVGVANSHSSTTTNPPHTWQDDEGDLCPLNVHQLHIALLPRHIDLRALLPTPNTMTRPSRPHNFGRHGGGEGKLLQSLNLARR